MEIPFGVSEANVYPLPATSKRFQGVDGELGLVQLEASAPMTVRVNSPVEASPPPLTCHPSIMTRHGAIHSAVRS